MKKEYTEIDCIKLAWRFSDNIDYHYIMDGAEMYNMSPHKYIMMQLNECGVGVDDEQREIIANYIIEHF